MPLSETDRSVESPSRRALLTALTGRRDGGRSNSFQSAENPVFMPPWAGEWDAYLAACTGCGDCVRACPSHVLRLDQGRAVFDPALGGCDFCAACVDSCDTKVLSLQRSPFAMRAQVGSGCLPRTGVECRVCADQCEAGAIRFRPRLGGPALPDLLETACTGCGACVAPCPAGAMGLADPLMTQTGG